MTRWLHPPTIVLCLTTAASAGEADERDIKPSDLPAAVTASVESHYPGATIREASVETHHGTKTWEAAITTAGRKLDLAFAEDGTLVEEEEQIDPSALPDPVKTAIAKQAPGSAATKAERSVASGKTSYEVVIETKGKKTEYVFDETGALVDKDGEESSDHEKK